MKNLKELSEHAISLYATVCDIDQEKAHFILKDLIYYYGSKKSDRRKYNPFLPLEQKWYEAQDNGYADYDVYADKYYFVDLIACYWNYSRGYIRSLEKKSFDNKSKSLKQLIPNAKNILDLGCGLGYTTIDLKKLFPNAELFGTNFTGTPQWDFCLKNLDGIATMLDENNLPDISADIVFASEFFEHIERPMEFIDKLFLKNSPGVLVLANSFNTKSIGHFYNYKHHEGVIPQERVSKYFNDYLRGLGYEKLKTSIWNNKPTVWLHRDYTP